MKKILSLALVCVMLVVTLASCSYNFANDSMSNYVTFGDSEFKAFKDALLKLTIEDGSFTPTKDGEIRAQKVLETVYNTVGKEADLTAKLTEGTPGTYDILYYAYYCTANFEGAENVVLYASNMKESSATKLQLGMVSTAGDLDTAIMEAIKDKDIKDYLYKTDVSTETVLKYGDKVYVSYTYDYTKDGAIKTVKATYELMTLTEGDELSKAIIDNCQKVATKKDTFKVTIDGVERTYKNTIVDWVVTEDNKLGEFAVKDFDDTKSVTDVAGASRKLADIKDKTITYHVYPVYFVKSPEFTATLILDSLVGASLTKDLFDVFKNEDYKTTVDGKEVKLSALVEELAALCKSRDDAETALSTAEKTLESKKEAVEKAGENATEAQKTAVETAEAAVKTAKDNLDAAQGKVDTKIEQIFATGSDVEDKIIEEYKKLAEETLENEYNNAIIEKIAKEVWALIETVKVNSLPEKAVNEAYERILENHEYTFYTGTAGSSSSQSNYSKYNGSFDAYLIETFAKGKTKADALAEVRKQAEEAVKPIVQLYAVAEKYDCVVTDKEYKEEFVKGNSSYDYYVETYGETNLRTVYQFDKLLSTILEVETYEDGDNKGEMKEYVYTEGVTEGKLPFKNIKYEIKAEEDESEED
ncbi:MAG: hypothetical protein IKC34_03735 [Clostridia bacterium]|nr:hypothetical protein [Clostridia bacterium]